MPGPGNSALGDGRVVDVSYTAFHNYDQAVELFASDDTFYVVPKFPGQPVNAWCVYDEKTLRTTKVVRACLPSELVFEDGVQACYEKAYCRSTALAPSGPAPRNRLSATAPPFARGLPWTRHRPGLQCGR